MKGIAPTVVFNNDQQDPLVFAQQLQLRKEKEEAMKAQQADKAKQERNKEFAELYKIDPGAPWEKYNDQIHQKTSSFREWISEAHMNGIDPNDPQFRSKYNSKKQQLQMAVNKTNYVKDFYKNYMDAIRKDPYRQDSYYDDKFLDLIQDEYGNPRDLTQLDLEQLEQIQYDMGGYDVKKVADDFMNGESIKNNVLTYLQQKKDRYGGIINERRELEASPIFKVKENPDGTFGVEEDPVTGNPIIDITDNVVGAWKSDAQRKAWLQKEMAQTGIDPYKDTESYKAKEKEILEEHLVPFAHRSDQIKSASRSKDHKADRISAEKQKKIDWVNRVVYGAQHGEKWALDILRRHPAIEDVEFKEGKITLYKQGSQYGMGNEIADVIDISDESGGYAEIYEYINDKDKPTLPEMEEAGPFVPDKPYKDIPKEQAESENAIIKGFQENRGIEALNNHSYNGKKINNAEAGETTKVGDFMGMGGAVQAKTVRLTLEGGEVVEIPAEKYEEFEKILRTEKSEIGILN